MANEMKRAAGRDVFVIVLFGVCSPWLWVYLMGLLADFEVPVLSALSHRFVSIGKTFVASYLLAFDVFAALVCGAVIGLPLGYFLRGGALWGWLQFGLLFWVAGAVAAFFSDEPFDLSYLYAHRDVWLFLAASAIFVVVGQKLWRRRGTERAVQRRRRGVIPQ